MTDKLKVSYYHKKGDTWILKKSDYVENSNIDAKHWTDWYKIDISLGAVNDLITRNGTLIRYETISPMGDEKVVYERV
jgi:hypothetical protein